MDLKYTEITSASLGVFVLNETFNIRVKQYSVTNKKFCVSYLFSKRFCVNNADVQKAKGRNRGKQKIGRFASKELLFKKAGRGAIVP